MQNVSIGRCTAGEIEDVVRFIDTHWKKGHPLATCRTLLDWQHRDADGAGYSFVVARRRADGDLLGILGYIPTRRFDPSLTGANVVWLTTWKARADAGVAGLGLQLLQHLAAIEPHCAMGAIFPSPAMTPLFRALGYRVGELQHYVRPNEAAGTTRIATGMPQASGTTTTDSRIDVRRLAGDEDFTALRLTGREPSIPRKTPEYFRRRYARHPHYRYIVLALLDGGAPAGLLAARTASHAGARALRIVDFTGSPDLLARAGAPIQRLLEEFGAEYADVYNTGIDRVVFERAGFTRVDPDGHTIVPDHFEPFELRNERLWTALKGLRPGDNPILFKGDSDRDRPNVVPHAST